MSRHLPAHSTQRTQQDSGSSKIWVRILAFLSTKAPTTRVTYEGVLHEWCSYLGASAKEQPERAAHLIVSATDLHATAYRRWLEGQPGTKPRMGRRYEEQQERQIRIERRAATRKKEGLEATQSNATIAKKFAVLRRVYRMLIAADVGVKLNPFDSDRVPPPPKDSGRKRPTEMIDFSVVKRIIEGIQGGAAKELRDRAIMAVFFGGGLRRSEVQGLRIGDVRKTGKGTTFLYLRATKGKKDAQQAIPGWAAESVWSLVAARQADGALSGDYLFVGYTGQGGKKATNDRISASGIYKLFLHHCRMAGVETFVSPHSARATSITKLLADGVSHRMVQEFSRHASVQMVELYDKRRVGVDQNPGKDLDF